MFLVGLISWWYGRGWIGQWKRMAGRFASTLEFFSIGQLLSTLFSPFRQISANAGNDGSFPAVFRAFVDKLISRLIGSIIRFFTIIFGIITIILQAVYELVIVVAWWFLPLLPIVGFVLLALGWTPTWK
ncbi:MAG: hypothetical protein ACREGE_04060 [Candidatus Microsaccharimonas sp.]